MILWRPDWWNFILYTRGVVDGRRSKLDPGTGQRIRLVGGVRFVYIVIHFSSQKAKNRAF